MALPSLADIIFAVVFLIPGFVALTLLRRVAIFERKLTDLELTIWSIFFSLLIYVIYGSFWGFTNIDAIRDNALVPENLAIILGLSLSIGIVPALVIKRSFRRHIIQGDCWQVSMNKRLKNGSWVIIYTSDGHEYKGILHYYGGKESSKEVSLRNPKLILRNSQWDIKDEIDMGKEILFSEKDITRVVFF